MRPDLDAGRRLPSCVPREHLDLHCHSALHYLDRGPTSLHSGSTSSCTAGAPSTEGLPVGSPTDRGIPTHDHSCRQQQTGSGSRKLFQRHRLLDCLVHLWVHPYPLRVCIIAYLLSVNFDFPSSLADKTCHMVFTLPTQDQLETSAFELGGQQTFTLSYLAEVATKETTYNNAPKEDDILKSFTITPSTAVTISEREGCSAGSARSFRLDAVGDSYINYFQDFNPCRKSTSLPSFMTLTDLLSAIGLYVMPS